MRDNLLHKFARPIEHDAHVALLSRQTKLTTETYTFASCQFKQATPGDTAAYYQRVMLYIERWTIASSNDSSNLMWHRSENELLKRILYQKVSKCSVVSYGWARSEFQHNEYCKCWWRCSVQRLRQIYDLTSASRRSPRHALCWFRCGAVDDTAGKARTAEWQNWSEISDVRDLARCSCRPGVCRGGEGDRKKSRYLTENTWNNFLTYSKVIC